MVDYRGAVDFVFHLVRPRELRPTELFRRGDQVHVKGTDISGTILKLEPDGRLAYLSTFKKDGWWYLKDLEKVGSSAHDTEQIRASDAFNYFLIDPEIGKHAGSPIKSSVVCDVRG